MTYLTNEEWEKLNDLLEKKEGTNYYDILECLIMCLPGELHEKVREQKPGLSDLAFLIQKYQAGELTVKPDKPRRTGEEK